MIKIVVGKVILFFVLGSGAAMAYLLARKVLRFDIQQSLTVALIATVCEAASWYP